jgi:type IV pilus assembly protein PilP
MIKLMHAVKNVIKITAIITLLSGCFGHGQDDLDKYIQKVKARPPLPIQPIPVIKPLPDYSYPENLVRRSPFVPVNIDTSKAPDRNRKKDPLEAFPLDALKFVGTITEGPITWALIQEPSGKITYIRPGQYMGKNFGKVLSIGENKIKLQETVNVGGKWEKKNTHLELYRKK